MIEAFIGTETGQRYVVANDRILFVHGRFCTGCNARTGNCGQLTELLQGERLQGRVVNEMLR